MIRTYLINRNELSEIPYTQDMLSSDRKEKIDKLKRDEDKARSACAELLLIYALKQLGETQLPLPIVQDERSKPAIQGSPWQFSLSHAGDYAVCAVSDAPVGVDIEYVRVKEIPAAERILHPEEAQLLLYISNANEKKKYFYECWVAKESYLKNLGIGLIVRPRDFLVSEDRLKIRDREFTDLKGHHSIAAQLTGSQGASAGKEQESGKDNTLEQNLSYLEHRYVHVFEPGEIRGTDWKFDAGYRAAVCSPAKDPDSVARLIHAADINQVLGL